MRINSCCTYDYQNSISFGSFTQIMQDLIQKIWGKDGSKFSKGHYQETVRQLIDGLDYKRLKNPNINISYNSPDYRRKNLMEANIFRFSAAKTTAMVMQMNQLAKKVERFSDFKKGVDALDLDYNKRWLEAEYDMVHAVSQNASNYQTFQEEKELFPYLQYQTIGDQRVRKSHAALDGKIYKIGDPALDIVFPPNGWGCRCEMIQITEDDVYLPDLMTKEDTIQVLKDSPITKDMSEWDYMVKHRFNVNKGKTAIIFRENEMYLSRFDDLYLAPRDYDLPKFKDMSSRYSPLAIYRKTVEEVDTFFKNKVGRYDLNDSLKIRLLDYKRNPVELEKSVLKKGSSDYYNELEPTLQSPDEIWLHKEGTYYSKRYLKFFRNEAVVVETLFNGSMNEMIINFKNVSPARVDAYRRGCLIKN